MCGCVILSGAAGCATVPPPEDRTAFLADAQATVEWFQEHVEGLREQIANSAGYTVFPDMLQWGTGLGGGRWGRGMVATSDGTQIGWSAISTSSYGLQAGLQGFKMLVIFRDDTTLAKFRRNRLSGAVSAVVVAVNQGKSTTAPIEDGVAVYQGSNSGLMAGINVGLDFMRFAPLHGGPVGRPLGIP